MSLFFYNTHNLLFGSTNSPELTIAFYFINNGNTENTSYENLYKTNHAETVELIYDGKEESLKRILEYFYYIIDPFSINKQGNDIGSQYRSGIFSNDEKDLEFSRKFLDKKQKNEELPAFIAKQKVLHFS